MQKLKLAYFGSPSFSADLLEEIISDKTLPVEVVLVITQPDKPVGRKQILTPSLVKAVAQKYHIPIVKTLNVTRYTLHKTDLCLVYAYGEIIPKDILSIPQYGFWNIHPSLLPFYRGASPIAYPLILGDKHTGVSFMLMDEEMDHGPLLAQEKMEILPIDTRVDLEIKLTHLAFEMFKKQINKLSLAKNADFLPGHLCNNARATPPALLTLARDKKYAFELISQDHTHATYTFRFKKSDGYIAIDTLNKMLKNETILIEELPAFLQKYINKYVQKKAVIQLLLSSSFLLHNIYKGLSPWPGLWTLLPNGKRLKISKLTMEQSNHATIKSVQIEGKKEVDFVTFQKAYSLF